MHFSITITDLDWEVLRYSFELYLRSSRRLSPDAISLSIRRLSRLLNFPELPVSKEREWHRIWRKIQRGKVVDIHDCEQTHEMACALSWPISVATVSGDRFAPLYGVIWRDHTLEHDTLIITPRSTKENLFGGLFYPKFGGQVKWLTETAELLNAALPLFSRCPVEDNFAVFYTGIQIEEVTWEN